MNFVKKEDVVEELILAGKRLDARKLNAGTDGNLSYRLDENTIIITASGKIKGLLSPEDFILVSMDGTPVNPDDDPSSETHAHTTAYSVRPDIRCVIHAHPPHGIACTLAGHSLEGIHIAEAAYAMGSVPTCSFAVPGTDEGGESIRPWIGKRDVLLMDRHGALTVGETIRQALSRMEMLDAVAYEILLAGGPGKIKPLSVDEVKRIYSVVQAAQTTHPDSLDDWYKNAISYCRK